MLLEYGVKDVYTYALGTVQYGDLRLPADQNGTSSVIVANQPFGAWQLSLRYGLATATAVEQ